MAVRQRFFNSTAPFSDSPKELKGTCPSSSSVEQETEDEEEEGKDNTKGYVDVAEWAANPFFNKLLTQGTAEQVGEKPIKTSTIIAQAECKHVCYFFQRNDSAGVPGKKWSCFFFLKVKPRTLRSSAPHVMNALLFPPLTALPAGMMFTSHHFGV